MPIMEEEEARRTKKLIAHLITIDECLANLPSHLDELRWRGYRALSYLHGILDIGTFSTIRTLNDDGSVTVKLLEEE